MYMYVSGLTFALQSGFKKQRVKHSIHGHAVRRKSAFMSRRGELHSPSGIWTLNRSCFPMLRKVSATARSAGSGTTTVSAGHASRSAAACKGQQARQDRVEPLFMLLAGTTCVELAKSADKLPSRCNHGGVCR